MKSKRNWFMEEKPNGSDFHLAKFRLNFSDSDSFSLVKKPHST